MNPKGSPTPPVKVNAVDTLAKWQELTGATHPPAIIQCDSSLVCEMVMISGHDNHLRSDSSDHDNQYYLCGWIDLFGARTHARIGNDVGSTMSADMDLKRVLAQAEAYLQL